MAYKFQKSTPICNPSTEGRGQGKKAILGLKDIGRKFKWGLTEMLPVLAPDTNEYEPIPDREVRTPIKPSEAIRLGRLRFPQYMSHGYFVGQSACTLGAMMSVYGADDPRKYDERSIERIFHHNGINLTQGQLTVIAGIPSFVDDMVGMMGHVRTLSDLQSPTHADILRNIEENLIEKLVEIGL